MTSLDNKKTSFDFHNKTRTDEETDLLNDVAHALGYENDYDKLAKSAKKEVRTTLEEADKSDGIVGTFSVEDNLRMLHIIKLNEIEEEIDLLK